MVDIAVVGSGPAGVTAALRARELGASVALVERGNLGGTCTNDGCVPTRVLAHAARLIRDSEQYARYGLQGERPEVDFAQLLAQTQDAVYRVHEKKQLPGHLREMGVELHVRSGNAAFADPHTLILGTGERLSAEKFILCAGGHARRLPFPGAELALTHSDVWALKQLPRSLVIIGGAATGCQLASVFAAFGSDVTILEAAPRILSVEDEDVSRAIAGAFAHRGITVIEGIGGIQSITHEASDSRTDAHLRVTYILDGGERHACAEAVVMAAGWPGNAETLNLEVAGVASERGYIIVDDTLRTTAPHIYAAGDITGRMMLVQSATAEGRLAAENAVSGSQHAAKHAIVPHGGFTDPEYASVGLTEATARTHGEYIAVTVPYAEMDRAVIDGHTDGFCKLIAACDGRILGAHIVGEQALEVLQLVAAGIAAGMDAAQLAALELAYPTYTAIAGIAARQLLRELGTMPVLPQWRTLGRMRAAEWERRDPLDGDAR